MIKDYNSFLLRKKRLANSYGFAPLFMPDTLKEFQKFSVHVALKKGRFALFEDCGLGKTYQDLVWSQNVYQHTGKPVLNLAPLAVTDQTIREGNKFGIEVNNYGSGNIQITNYEQIDNINPDLFGGIVLDESSIIKNHEGATTNKVIERFKDIHYKLCSTATPSPNDAMELGNHAEFLGIMRRSEMLSTYFVHDGGETAKWRIKGHAQETFWKWVNSWSLMFSKPSDVGFSDEGYNLPPLKFIEREIITPQREGVLYNNIAVGASDFHKEVRISKFQRLDEVIRIVNDSDESFVIWIESNDDGKYLKKELPNAIEITGSDSDEFKKAGVLWFTENKCICHLTKKKTQRKQKDSVLKEAKMPNGTKPERSTTGNTTAPIKTRQENTGLRIQIDEMKQEENSMLQIQSIEQNVLNSQRNTVGISRKLNSEAELKSTELLLTNTTICLQSKIANVPFVNQNQALLIANNDYTLTIATQPEKSEGYYASTAIRVSENSTMIFDYLNEQSCTCGCNRNDKILISKVKILGYGINMQNCHNMIFASPDFSFEKLYQAIRRMLRFGQQHSVNAYLMVTDTMSNVIAAMDRKEKQHRLMQSYFNKHTKDLYGKEIELYATA